MGRQFFDTTSLLRHSSKALLGLVIIILSACNGTEETTSFAEQKILSPEGDLKIGQYTFNEFNLATTKFLNGDKIPQAQSNEEWLEAGKNQQAAWCFSKKKNKFGKKEMLYNYYALSDSRGIVELKNRITSQLVGQLQKSISKTSFDRFMKQHTEERNYSGNYYDLELVNWWLFKTDTTGSQYAEVACWDPELRMLKVQSVSKGNGFYIRCLSKK